MKKRIGILLFVIAIGIGWKSYLDYRTNTFTEKLPKAPAESQPATDSLDYTDTDETPQPAQTSVDTLEKIETTVEEAAPSDEQSLEESVETQHRQTSGDGDWRTDTTSSTAPPKSDLWAPTNPQPENGGSTHFSQMPPDKRADHLRDSWIRMFGDIPEVHTASDYLRKVMKNERMTIDEVIAGLEASHHLFPKSGFNLQLQNYKTMKEMGIPILYLDDME